MRNVLVIAEHAQGKLSQSTARCVACANLVDGSGADVVVLSDAGRGVAEQAASIAGVARVLLVERAENRNALAAVLAPQVAELADAYECVLAPSTTFGKDLLPRVAALLGAGQISDIMHVDGPRAFQRPIYAGNAIVSIEVPAGQKIIGTVRGASFKPAGSSAAAPIEKRELKATVPTHSRFVELRGGAGTTRPDLQTARVVVSGGRGVGSAENFSILYRLADKVGAGVGASRAAVDAGFVPNDMQVGQTGKIIAPELYLAFGISGAIQHLTGIKDAGLIVAINKDADAPIFQIADLGLVGDLFQIVPELEKRLG